MSQKDQHGSQEIDDYFDSFLVDGIPEDSVTLIEDWRRQEHAKMAAALIGRARSPETGPVATFRPGDDPIKRIW